jgi:hypothetical protein
MKRRVLLLNIGDIIIDDNKELLVRSTTIGITKNYMLVHYKDLSTGKNDWKNLPRDMEFKIKERR